MIRALFWLLLVGAVMMVLVGTRPATALPDYTAKTGQACTVCHVPPGMGGPLTELGQAFQAIPEHIADPAGAWAQVAAPPEAPAAEAPAPEAPAPEAPAAEAPAPEAPAPEAPPEAPEEEEGG